MNDVYYQNVEQLMVEGRDRAMMVDSSMWRDIPDGRPRPRQQHGLERLVVTLLAAMSCLP